MLGASPWAIVTALPPKVTTAPRVASTSVVNPQFCLLGTRVATHREQIDHPVVEPHASVNFPVGVANQTGIALGIGRGNLHGTRPNHDEGPEIACHQVGQGIGPVAKNARLALVGAILGRQAKDFGLGLEPAPESERSTQSRGRIAARALRSLHAMRHAQVRPLGEKMSAREGAYAEVRSSPLYRSARGVEIAGTHGRRGQGGKQQQE